MKRLQWAALALFLGLAASLAAAATSSDATLLRTFIGAGGGALKQANGSAPSQPFNPRPQHGQTQSAQAQNLEHLIAENEWKNQLVVWLIPEHIRCKLPRVVQVCWVTVRS